MSCSGCCGGCGQLSCPRPGHSCEKCERRQSSMRTCESCGDCFVEKAGEGYVTCPRCIEEELNSPTVTKEEGEPKSVTIAVVVNGVAGHSLHPAGFDSVREVPPASDERRIEYLIKCLRHTSQKLGAQQRKYLDEIRMKDREILALQRRFQSAVHAVEDLRKFLEGKSK